MQDASGSFNNGFRRALTNQRRNACAAKPFVRPRNRARQELCLGCAVCIVLIHRNPAHSEPVCIAPMPRPSAILKLSSRGIAPPCVIMGVHHVARKRASFIGFWMVVGRGSLVTADQYLQPGSINRKTDRNSIPAFGSLVSICNRSSVGWQKMVRVVPTAARVAPAARDSAGPTSLERDSHFSRLNAAQNVK